MAAFRAMKNTALSLMDRTIGTWNITGTHPALPGRKLPGRVTFERIEGGAFIRIHSKMEDPEFPEGVAIFGTDTDDGSCTMLYFDERNVGRRYNVDLHENGFTWSRENPKFSQRFRVTIAEDGRSMSSEGTMRKGDGEWEPDLCLAYVRAE